MSPARMSRSVLSVISPGGKSVRKMLSALPHDEEMRISASAAANGCPQEKLRFFSGGKIIIIKFDSKVK